MDLRSQLAKYNEASIKRLPADIKKLFRSEAQRLVDEGIGKTALKSGDKIPEFKLKNAFGELVSSDELLGKGPLIITFYRGAWCPYCNLELSAYQNILPEIKEAGGHLVGISPELPDTSMTLVEKHTLKFEILSDINNELAELFGLKFKLSPDLSAAYKGFGYDLVKAQGNDKYELPVPATYVVNSDGTIVLDYVNSDYTKRLGPKEALDALINSTY